MASRLDARHGAYRPAGPCLIPDPYVGAPEAGLQWIRLADWEYRTTFRSAGASPSCAQRTGVRGAGHVRRGVPQRREGAGRRQRLPYLAHSRAGASARRRQRAARGPAFADQAPAAGRAGHAASHRRQLPLALRRRAEGRHDGQLRTQARLPLWLGLGAALRHGRHLARGATDQLGCRPGAGPAAPGPCRRRRRRTDRHPDRGRPPARPLPGSRVAGLARRPQDACERA